MEVKDVRLSAKKKIAPYLYVKKEINHQYVHYHCDLFSDTSCIKKREEAEQLVVVTLKLSQTESALRQIEAGGKQARAQHSSLRSRNALW